MTLNESIVQEAAISGFNSFVKEQLKAPGEANLSLLLFDDEFLQVCDRVPLKEVRGLNAKTLSEIVQEEEGRGQFRAGLLR